MKLEGYKKMVFIPPTWFEGLLFQSLCVIIPVIVSAIIFTTAVIFDSDKLLSGSFIVLFVGLIVGVCGIGLVWHEVYEIPSVDEKVITVQEWQPKVGIETDGGMMHIDSADDLMLVTTDGECYYNEENFLFQKFDTRDVFNTLKEGGTYKIEYYGWREPFNNGFPNLLSVEKVINESNVTNKHYSNYFGTKLSN